MKLGAAVQLSVFFASPACHLSAPLIPFGAMPARDGCEGVIGFR